MALICGRQIQEIPDRDEICPTRPEVRSACATARWKVLLIDWCYRGAGQQFVSLAEISPQFIYGFRGAPPCFRDPSMSSCGKQSFGGSRRGGAQPRTLHTARVPPPSRKDHRLKTADSLSNDNQLDDPVTRAGSAFKTGTQHPYCFYKFGVYKAGCLKSAHIPLLDTGPPHSSRQ